jgi:hypothetical protein
MNAEANANLPYLLANFFKGHIAHFVFSTNKCCRGTANFIANFFVELRINYEEKNMILDSQSPTIKKLKEEIIKIKEMIIMQNNVLEILMAEYDKNKEEHE